MHRLHRLVGLALTVAVLTTGPVAVADPTSAGGQVRPIDWAALGSYSAADDAGQRMRQILQNSSRYLIGPWYAGKYHELAPDGYLDLGGTDERAVRLPAMTAMSVASALRLDAYDPKDLSVENATIREMNLVASIAARHEANNADPASAWGSGWQTALWAYYGGSAAWLMWDNLSDLDRDKVVTMLVSEADRLTTGDDVYLVGDSGDQLYLMRRDGTVVTPGDSKAEEDSWNAALLGLAVAMMPEHPNADAWQRRNVELLLASAARPADLDDPTTINGVPMSWLQGTNIADDGTLENHGILHPLYMVSFDQNLYQGAVAGLGRTCAAEAARHNMPPVYDALVDKQFDGKTIYIPDSAEIHYPEGNDWGTDFPGYFGNFDMLVSLYGQDTEASVKAEVWEKLHNEGQLAMQARFTDGRTYGADGENTYYGREQRIGVMAGQAYLSLWLARNDTGSKVCWTNDG